MCCSTSSTSQWEHQKPKIQQGTFLRHKPSMVLVYAPKSNTKKIERSSSPWSPFPFALVQDGGGEAWGLTTGAKALFCFTAEMTLAGSALNFCILKTPIPAAECARLQRTVTAPKCDNNRSWSWQMSRCNPHPESKGIICWTHRSKMDCFKFFTYSKKNPM